MNPWDWKIISSMFPPDSLPVSNKRYEEWLLKHTHNHQIKEIMIALKGTCLLSLDHKVYECTPGTVFFFDSYEDHDYYYPPFTGDVAHLWIGFVNEKMFARIYNIENRKHRDSRRDSLLISCNEAALLLSKSWDEAKQSKNFYSYQHLRLKILTALSATVMQLIESKLESGQESESQAIGDKIDTIAKYIYDTSGKGTDLKKMATLAGYSKFHFARVFKEHTGHSFHKYVNMCRIRRLKELETQSLTKKEICYRLGFSCPAAFSRWYSKTIKNKYDL